MLIKSDLYELNAIWSRLIHRFHTLGTTQQTYINSISGIIERRIYPHHISTSKEDKSTSIGGAQIWHTDQWKKGWVTIKEAEETGSFLFASNTGSIFHKIELLPESEWECFKCILKIFHHKKINNLNELSKKKPQIYHVPDCSQYAHAVLDTLDNSASENKAIRFVMPTAGGLVTRSMHLNELSLNSSIITVKSNDSRVAIDMTKVSHVDINKRPNKELTTLSNKRGTPQFIIETTR